MKKERAQRVLSLLEKQKVSQILITDPYAIAWLTDVQIEPGERFLGLLLREGKEAVLFLNRLFSCPRDGFEIVPYEDGDDIVKLVQPYVDEKEVLAVDKCMQAVFLLSFMKASLAKRFVNGSPAVDAVRAVKDEEELGRLRRASLINDQAMTEFCRLVHAGVTEREIAGQMLAVYRSLGAESFSFPPIVSFGPHAADPHHMPDDTVLQMGDCVLLDVGCVYQGYCSDMTRTFYYGKMPSPRIQKIYRLVQQANEKAEAMERPGMKRSDIDGIARSLIAEGGYGEAFNHRLGHFIGRQDHEAGDISAADSALLEPGNVHSIEPGIYLAGDTGVRIEDLVVVTREGVEVLNAFPKDLTVLPA